jgi:hypothetical protein
VVLGRREISMRHCHEEGRFVKEWGGGDGGDENQALNRLAARQEPTGVFMVILSSIFMSGFWKLFWKFTGIVFVILVMVFAVAWFFAPGEHFIRISCILHVPARMAGRLVESVVVCQKAA